MINVIFALPNILFVNLTPHNIIIVNGSDEPYQVIPPSGDIARCKEDVVKIGTIGGIPLLKTIYGDVEGLPEPRKDVYYIVSTIVRVNMPSRHDLLSPGQLVRNELGQPIGCRGLVK